MKFNFSNIFYRNESKLPIIHLLKGNEIAAKFQYFEPKKIVKRV